MKPCDLFQFKINCEIIYKFDIWQDSLDGAPARRKASTSTGQHNTEKPGQTSMPWTRFYTTTPVWRRPRTTLDREAIVIGPKFIFL